MQILFLSLLLLFQTTDDDTTFINSEVSSATVYLSGAEVQRTIDISLKTGTNNIRFENLTASLNEQTLQLRTDADVVLESIAMSKNSDKNRAFSDQIAELEKQKASIQESIKRTEAAVTVLDRKLSVLMSNQDISGDNTKLSATELKQTMEYFGQQFEEIENQRIDLNMQLEELQTELEQINQNLNELRSKRTQTAAMVDVVIHSEHSQNAKLTLSYFTPEASWLPSYNVKVADTESPLTLDYKANISQATGNDWNNVNLTISSAEPRFRTKIPSLTPIYLTFLDNQAREQVQRQAEADAQMMARSQKMQSPAAIQTQRQEGETAFSFVIEKPYSIKTGHSSKSVTVESNAISSKYSYFAFPKKQKQVYLTAKIDNWESLNLLRGSVNLFLDNSFVGTTTIAPAVTTDSLSFSLGQDDRITVQRDQIEAFKEKNFFGNKVTETKGWKIQLRNTKSTAATIELVDQIPISTNEDITVELEERSGAKFDQSNGELRWNLVIDPSESRTVRFVYNITYPSDKTITQQ